MKNKYLYFLVFFCAITAGFAQGNDNAFQKYLATVQPIFSKNIENLNAGDIELLQKTMSLSPISFGVENQRLCNKLITDARNKKREYDEYMEKNKKIATTLDQLDQETDLRIDTERERDSVITENIKLQEIIASLNKDIANYEKQIKKIKSMNKKLQEEAMTTKDLLQTSSNMVAQLIMLMPKKNRIDNELRDSLPQTLKDSLENVQCEVSALLKSNYMITLESMRADKQFMDSAIVYFVTNQKHIADITNYVNVGQELIQRLRNSGVDCAIGYAADIENEINTFLLSIENADSSGSNIAEFIVNNLFWMIPVLLLLIAGIILVIKKTGKPKQ